MQQEDRGGNWITVNSGNQFWPLDPRPEDFHIEDIAASLAKVCRFNGHLDYFYTVAQHSVYVSAMVAGELKYISDQHDRMAQKFGLMHDSPESYVNDLCRPVKGAFREEAERMGQVDVYKRTENVLEHQMAKKFNIDLSPSILGVVKDADNAIVYLEAQAMSRHKMNTHLWGIPQAGWSSSRFTKMTDIDPDFFPWPWEIARERFLTRYNELFGD